MPSRIDEISRALGAIEATVDQLQERAGEDRETREQEHAQNQEAMGELRQSTQLAIAEMRQQISIAVDQLTAEVRRNGTGDHFHKSKIVALAGVGIFALWIVGRGLEAGLQWMIGHFLSIKWP